MSLIARQSIKFSIVSYFSFFIGTLASLFLYTNDFDFSGKISAVLSYAQIIYPFLTLGLGAAIVTFHQKLKDKNHEKSFFTFSLLSIICISILVFSIFYFLKSFFPRIEKTDFAQLSIYIFPLAFFITISHLYMRNSINFKRIVIPNLLQNLLPKLGAICCFSMFYSGYFNESISLFVFILFHFFILVFLFFYIQSLQKDNYSLNFIFIKDRKLIDEIKKYSLFSILGGMGNIVALQIDKAMIAEFLTFEAVGTYSVILALITLISIPNIGMYAITSPLIVEYFKNNDILSIKKLYQKTALILFFIGSLLLCMIFAGAESLFHLMKNGHKLIELMPVVYLLGFTTLVDIATGFNSNILSLSKYYKFNTLTLFGLAFVTIILNFIFIYYFKMGVVGVALATLISMVLFNTIKCLFIYQKFHFQPFSYKFLFIILMILISILVSNFVEIPEFNFSNNILKPKLNYGISLITKPFLVLFIFFIINLFANVIDIKIIFSKNWKNFLMGKN